MKKVCHEGSKNIFAANDAKIRTPNKYVLHSKSAHGIVKR